MTISTTITRVSFAGNGSTVAFATGFRFLENDDLQVILVNDTTGVETVQTITTHYSVTGAGDDAGGTVTMVTAPASGETLIIKRVTDRTQEADYISGDEFPAETHELALDKLTMLRQETDTEDSRFLKIPEADVGTVDPDLPFHSATDTGRFVARKADGSGFEYAPDPVVGEDAIAYFNGIAAMRAQTPTNGQTYWLRYHSTEGDGGGGRFRGVSGAGAGTYTDDNGVVILPTGGDGSAAFIREVSGPASAKWFNAAGDGSTDDTAAIDAAKAINGYVYLPDGTYKVTKQYDNTTSFHGPGKMVWDEAGYNRQVLGGFLFAGSHQSRGGEQRADRKGGVLVGGSPADPRGLQIHTEECSSWAFMKERSETGQSLLLNIQPNPLTVNGTVTVATDADRVVAGVGNFSSENWAVDALVQYNRQNYRIGAVDAGGTYIDLVNDDGSRTAVTLTSDTTDNCILPAHFFECVADVSGTALTITSGDDVPLFSSYDFTNDRVMALIDGTWYRVSANGSRYNLTLSSSAGTLSDESVRIMYQPDYSLSVGLKRTSGAGLEETCKIASWADAWRITSTGSNAAQHKPIIFTAGITGDISGAVYDVLEVHGDATKLHKPVEYSVQAINIADGSTNDISNDATNLVGYQTGTRATATIRLPTGINDGHKVTVSSAGAITALTVSSQGSETISNAPTTLAAGGTFSYIYVLSQDTWYLC